MIIKSLGILHSTVICNLATVASRHQEQASFVLSYFTKYGDLYLLLVFKQNVTSMFIEGKNTKENTNF